MTAEGLMEIAGEALQRAHAPYSGFRVGAAVLSARGAVYSGCNVESMAFPVGGCAEHHALAAAVLAEGAQLQVTTIAVRALDRHGAPAAAPPCGACRQLISELAPAAQVVFVSDGGRTLTRAIAELLPESFALATPAADPPR